MSGRTLAGEGARGERGQISLLILGFGMILITLILGALVVTNIHLAKVRLLDAADGAALAGANALDTGVYTSGLGGGIPVSGAGVQQAAADYLAARPMPTSVTSWRLAPGTGSPDGFTAVVVLQAQVDVPVLSPVLAPLGGSLTMTAEGRARSSLR